MNYSNANSLKPTNESCKITYRENDNLIKIKQELNDLQEAFEALKIKVDNRDVAIKTDSLVTKVANIGESLTTKELAVNTNALIEGVLNAGDAFFEGDVTIIGNLITDLLTVAKVVVNNADVNTAEIQSLLVEVIKLKMALKRNDTNQDVISFPSLNQTDLGDLGNKINITGLERPTYNGTETLAFVSELSEGLAKNYKGVIATVDELPVDAKNGDYYIITSLTIGAITGLGYALYNEGTYSKDLFFELLNYYNKDDINNIMDLELQDDIERETDIIKGNTPVQAVANGCVMKRDDGTSDRLAVAVDALMLTGPEGMDNINPNTSLDDLFVCGQYSADNELAKLITDKPSGETMAFDLTVGYFSGDKQNIYQLYTSKETQKNYFRIGIDKIFNGWKQIAYTDSLIDNAKKADFAEVAKTHRATTITGLGLSIDSLNNTSNTYGQLYTGLGSDWTDAEHLPPEASGSHGFVLEVLPNKSNTVHRYTYNRSSKLYTYVRVYNNGSWTEWQESTYLDSNGYVDKAKTADNLNSGAKLDGSLVATQKDIAPLQNDVTLGKSAITQLRTDVDTNKTGIQNVIDGTTPVTKVSDTATKGGNKIATNNNIIYDSGEIDLNKYYGENYWGNSYHIAGRAKLVNIPSGYRNASSFTILQDHFYTLQIVYNVNDIIITRVLTDKGEVSVDWKELATTDGIVNKATLVNLKELKTGIDPKTEVLESGLFSINTSKNMPTSTGDMWHFLKWNYFDQSFILALNPRDCKIYLDSQFGQWKGWQRIATIDDLFSTVHRPDTDVKDLNFMTKTGIYQIHQNGTIANMFPTAGNFDHTLIVLRNSYEVLQIGLAGWGTETGGYAPAKKVFIRRRYWVGDGSSTGWTDWDYIVTSRDLTPVQTVQAFNAGIEKEI